MSTFLELCKRLRQEVGGAGTGPTAVSSQTGELGRIVSWITTADEDVQRLHNDWRFMVGSFTLPTVAADNSYAPADCSPTVTNLRDWKRDSIKIYLTSTADETKLARLDYQEWYDQYNLGSQTNQRPRHYAVGNDLSLKLGQTPDVVYQISGEYHKSVTTMTADANTPVYPSEFHILPVYLGMMMYGRYTGANEIYQDGEIRYKRMIKQMERTQLPEISMWEPLT